MKPDDLCLALFPFGGAGGRKLRPVLVLTAPLGAVPEYVVVYVSSAVPPDPMTSDLWLDPALPSMSGTGLSKLSVVRLHKLSTLHQRDLVRRLGAVPRETLDASRQHLRNLLNL